MTNFVAHHHPYSAAPAFQNPYSCHNSAQPAKAMVTMKPSCCPTDEMAALRWAQMARFNPFAAFAMFAVCVMVEAWNALRTPAEGMVCRNDNLEGMLRNQGYSLEEIYACDDSGYDMLARVSAANGLRNPNLLVPHKPLVLPTRFVPEHVEGNRASGPNAQANACSSYDAVLDTSLLTFAQAQGERAIANAEMNVGTAVDSTVETVAQAQGERAVANAETNVGNAVNSTVETAAVAEGENSLAAVGTFTAEAQGSILVASAESVDGRAEAYVENAGEGAGSTAVVTAIGTQGAHAESSGVERADITAVSSQGAAVVEMEAVQGTATLIGEEARATTVGVNSQGSLDIDVTGDAVIRDEGRAALYGYETGNSIDVSAWGQNMSVFAAGTAEFDVRFEGRTGDNLVTGNLPQGGELSRLDMNLGDGYDRVELQRGSDSDSIVITKTEGELELNLHNGTGMDDIGRNTTVIDGGNSTVTGRIGGSQGDDLTVLRGANFEDRKSTL